MEIVAAVKRQLMLEDPLHTEPIEYHKNQLSSLTAVLSYMVCTISVSDHVYHESEHLVVTRKGPKSVAGRLPCDTVSTDCT